MQGGSQYEKYKQDFKNVCVLKAVSAAAAICAITLFLFVPSFLIVLKLGDEVTFRVSFSLFDEIVRAVSSFTNSYKGTAEGDYIDFLQVFLNAYQIIAMVYFAIAFIFIIYNFIKSIIGACDLDNYALNAYDDVKKRNEQKKRIFSKSSFGRMLISGIMLEIFYIIFSKIWGTGAVDETEAAISNCNAVSWNICFAVLMFAAFCVLSFLASRIQRKVKSAILKEDYEIAEN